MTSMADTTTAAKNLHNFGMTPMWLWPTTKKPKDLGWNSKPRPTLSEFMDNYVDGDNLAVRTGRISTCKAGLALGVLDVDLKSSEQRHIDELRTELARLLPNPESYPCVLSGRANGSRHYWMGVEEGYVPPTTYLAKSREKIEDTGKHAWEIQWISESKSGYGMNIVCPPSVHPDTGERYTWEREFKGALPMIPETILAKLKEQQSVSHIEVCASVGPTISLGQLSLPKWLLRLIQEGEGVDKYESRSEALYAVMMELIKTNASDETIAKILTDSHNAISEKALSKYSKLDDAKRWILGQLAKLRSGSVLDEKAENCKLRTFDQFCINDLDEFGDTTKQDFLVPNMIVNGEFTVIYADPNVGKTLVIIKSLMNAVEAGSIIGDQIIYINADDSRQGAVLKGKLLGQYGIRTIIPSYKNFSVSDLEGIMIDEVKSGKANGRIIVIDTLTQFADAVDVKQSRQFAKTARSYVIAGGSVILLAHTKKERDIKGQSVYRGTTDIRDSCDCSIIANVEVDGPTRTVCFKSDKVRGGGYREVRFQYDNEKTTDYTNKLSSLIELNEEQAAEYNEVISFQQQLKIDSKIIGLLVRLLENRPLQKTEFSMMAKSQSGTSRTNVARVIESYEVSKCGSNGFWVCANAGLNNAMIYKLTDSADNLLNRLNL